MKSWREVKAEYGDHLAGACEAWTAAIKADDPVEECVAESRFKMIEALRASSDGFIHQLYRLIDRADPIHRARIALGYPLEVAIYMDFAKDEPIPFELVAEELTV